jgi:hypothetical protein
MDARRHARHHALRPLRYAIGALLGLAWCAATLRVAVHPAQAGPVEQGLAVGGWTLSLLPVHVAPWRRAGTRGGRAGTPPARPEPPAAMPVPRTPDAVPGDGAGATPAGTAWWSHRRGAKSGR